MKELTQSLFDGMPREYRSIGVDYDGTLNYFDTAHIRTTWASGSWRGGNILKTIKNTPYRLESCIIRESAKGKCPDKCSYLEMFGKCDRLDGGWGCGKHTYEEDE